MFKRLFWFTSGAATGAAGSWYVKRRIKEKMRQFTPGGIRDRAIARARKASADAKIVRAVGRRLAAEQRDTPPGR